MRVLLIGAMALGLAACNGVQGHYPNDGTNIKGDARTNVSHDHTAKHHMGHVGNQYTNEYYVNRHHNHPHNRYHSTYHHESSDRYEFRPCTPHRTRQGVC